MLGIPHLDRDDIVIARRDQLAELLHVTARIEQGAQRRIADRPALHLVDLVVDQIERLAIRDDQHVGALLVFEADFSGSLEREHAREGLSLAIGLGEVRRHRRDAAKRGNRLVELTGLGGHGRGGQSQHRSGHGHRKRAGNRGAQGEVREFFQGLHAPVINVGALNRH